MKVRKIFIASIIINILLIGVVYNFIKKDYLNNKKIIVKAMTEGEYEANITSLNTSHEDYANYIEESKKQIASAITDMGVITSNDATAETMASNIRSITGVASADKVSYDNTNSGLTTTNVQGAVDELNESLEDYETHPTTIDFIFNESSMIQGNRYFTPEKTGIYYIECGGTDTYSTLRIVDKKLNTTVYCYATTGTALNLYVGDQIKLYKDIEYEFQCWNTVLNMFKY